MQQSDGNFVIPEEMADKFNKAFMPRALEMVEAGKATVLRRFDSMPEDAIAVEKLPRKNCPKCFGSGHKQQSSPAKLYVPCECTQ